MYENETDVIAHETVESIARDFNIENITLPDCNDDHNLMINELRGVLAHHLRLLLEKNPESLLNILYRIDIDEHKLNIIFNSENIPDIPHQLAELIIQREATKVMSRRQYKEKRLFD